MGRICTLLIHLLAQYPQLQDWPQLSQTVHMLSRFCKTDWLKTSQIVLSQSTLHYYITLLYTLEISGHVENMESRIQNQDK